VQRFEHTHGLGIPFAKPLRTWCGDERYDYQISDGTMTIDCAS
jgi:hypothetical protein